MTRINKYLKAFLQLNTKQVLLYLLYQAGLRIGYYRLLTKGNQNKKGVSDQHYQFNQLLTLPKHDSLDIALGESGRQDLMNEANEIVTGKARLFGSEPSPLVLSVPNELYHWTEYEKGTVELPLSHLSIPDIKFIWEPARFGWAFILGRAIYLSGDERYSEAFWKYFDSFSDSNPSNMGPNWISSQEVALRLIAFVFIGQILIASNGVSEQRLSRLTEAIAEHAVRIAPTLLYARAQNNNHLLVEAAGLISAALVLPNHPEASRWEKLGWKWFVTCLENQIANDGSYVQNSTNYHRLMLQVVLWVLAINTSATGYSKTIKKRSIFHNDFWDTRLIIYGDSFSRTLEQKIRLATEWLLKLVDDSTGKVPNLGPNDGANVLPLTVCPFHDYRPVIQAAAYRFLGKRIFEKGPWDEMVLWLEGCDKGITQPGADEILVVDKKLEVNNYLGIHPVPAMGKESISRPIRLSSGESWAYFRAAQFDSRPGHADQLHLDLWWRGINIAIDPGTYLYNGPTPWNNSLVHTKMHNTVTINHQDQMTHAGRFLWLDWAQAEIVSAKYSDDGNLVSITGAHDGYHVLGVRHQRTVIYDRDMNWVIKDELLPHARSKPWQKDPYQIRLHWLLPNWHWQVEDKNAKGCCLQLESPFGRIGILISIDGDQMPPISTNLQICRAGILEYGTAEDDMRTLGWISPTYGIKIPALSIAFHAKTRVPFTIVSEFIFPKKKN
ncbi:MAG: alginate lyase family protein [Anaerolineales bacterium]